MSEFADLTAAPVVVHINGTSYDVCPLTMADLGALERYLQFKPYYELQKTPEIPKEILDKTLADCVANKVELSAAFLEDMSQGIAGATEIVYLSLKHKRPELTREAVENFPVDVTAHLSTIIFALLEAKLNTGKAAEDAKKKAQAALAILRGENSPGS